jgi:hypothetical protein
MGESGAAARIANCLMEQFESFGNPQKRVD